MLFALASGGTVRFEAASDAHTEAHEKHSGNFAWQSSRGEGRTDETLRQSELLARGELVIQAAEGIVAEVPEIDAQSVRQTVDALVAANPDLAWLQDMEARGDIDWRRVKAIHDRWAYKHSGLGAGAILVIAIVASVFVGPAAAGMLGATGATGAAVSAAASSLATSATVSAVNNRGDMGDVFDDTFSSDSLRGAAVASAGITQGVMGDTTNTAGLDFSNAGDVARFAGERTAQTAINAGVSTAIEGGSLSDNLEAGLDGVLTEVVSAVLFDAVGDQNLPSGSPQKVALHALAGGAVAEAMGGDFRTGALAAGANEALVDHLTELVNNDPQLLVAASQITGIVAAELTDGDVNQGAEIAGYSTRYNRGRHPQEEALLAEQAVALEERLGPPQLQDMSWDDMLLLVSGTALDEQEAQRFMALLAHLESSSNDNNPLYQRFLQDLQTASTALQDLSSRYAGQALTWANGEPITAHGEEVTAFQATQAQYRDGGLFGDTDSGALGLGTLEAIRQYGAAQASQHQGEIAAIGASAPPMDEVYDRAYWNALGGGAESSTIDVDIALALTGTGAGARAASQGIRSWLQSRVSGATNRAWHEAYKTSIRQQMSKPSVQDARLARVVDELYRSNARVGSGSTADAIRYEVATGQSVSGRLHSQKGADAIRALERWLNNNPAARPGDRAAAENIILDLRDALGR